jgi:hypothetical protein
VFGECIAMASEGFGDIWWKGKIHMRGKLYVGVWPSPYFETKTQKICIYYDNKEATLPRTQPHIQNLRRN